MRSLRPKFFASQPSSSLAEVFKSLQHVNLTFRLSHAEREAADLGYEDCYEEALKGGALFGPLAAATGLKHLTIQFEEHDSPGPVLDIKHILADGIWPQLELLDLDNVSGDGEYFSNFLKRQTSLRDLRLAFATLKTGTWPAFISSISKLGLKSFTPMGIFEDSAETFIMESVDVDAWLDERSEITMVSNSLPERFSLNYIIAQGDRTLISRC